MRVLLPYRPRRLYAPTKVGVFDPLSLGPAAWWKQDTLSALSNGDPVGTWPDSSTNGRDLTQGTAGAKPTYTTAQLNGLPVVRFDGVDDHMATAAFTLNQPLTIFDVVKMRDTGGFRYLSDGNTGDSLLVYNGGNTDSLKMYAGSLGPSITVGITNFHVCTFKFNGASSAAYLDGGSAVTGSVGANNPGGMRLGAKTAPGSYGAYDVAERIVYPSALSDSDRGNVRDYLLTKYGL